VATPLFEQLQASLGTQYKLQRELGRGGMATVYLATDQKHGREVALKVLHPDLAATLGPERFRREIGFAATLSHPHILTVLDSGETADGQLWFTMPYVEGETLREHLRRDKQLPIDEALRITREIASALDYAHEKGVVHRDIKPENLLLTKRGDALLADFGIARALGSDTSAGGGLTQTGLAVGTPQYMSPEQASGERDLGSRSDIYTLGSVCYEMLAGEPPFTAPSTQAMIAKMMTSDAPSVRVLRPSVPQAVDAVLQKALARVPADRWATAGEFSRALEMAERSSFTGTATATTPTAREPVKRRVPTTALALILGILVGGGLLFAWRTKTHDVEGAPRIVRLAVLPFENVGDTSDAYFAAGVTDAVRGKLTGLPGIEVIGSASSAQYRNTTKSPQQIGQELGVRYLLIGRVHWARGAGGANRVQVSPELVDVTTAADKWQQPFDAPLTDVFQVQADIAGKVAHELQIALSPAVTNSLAEKPTTNLDAYDAYLRALDIQRRGSSPANLHRQAAELRHAIALDSSFALAWAYLGDILSLDYNNGIPSPALADSADRISAYALELTPQHPEALAGRANYLRLVRIDPRGALDELRKGLAREPSNVKLLRRAGGVESDLGQWEMATAHIKQAASLDPRSPTALGALGDNMLRQRRYPEAQAALERALSLGPDNLSTMQSYVMLWLMQGDLRRARAETRPTTGTVDQATIVAYDAAFLDLGWILDSAQERILLRLGSDAFNDDPPTRAIVFAQQYRFRGDSVRMRAYADTAVAGLQEQLKSIPGDAQRHVLMGLVLAYLGKKAEAIKEGEISVANLRTSDPSTTYCRHQLARIYVAVGDQEKALNNLEILLGQPYLLSPQWLRIDPNFAPLRGNPRFERLAGGAAKAS
jgi:serine/threonine-protein kinase